MKILPPFQHRREAIRLGVKLAAVTALGVATVPCWNRGEAISFTAIPRTPDAKNVTFENVDITFDRWTSYPGGLFDNRPTTAYPAIEDHQNPAYYIRYADKVVLKNCRVNWENNLPAYFSHALEAHHVTGLKLKGFKGEAAHPGKLKAISIT